MNRIARLLGLAAVLLIVFLAAVLASGLRLRQHTEQLRMETLRTKQAQLERILALTQPAALPWTDDYLGHLAAILDAQIDVLPAAPEGKTALVAPVGHWQFDHALRDSAGRTLATLRISTQPPPAVRLGALYRHTALILFVFALGLIAVLVAALLFNVRSSRDTATKAAPATNSAAPEFDSLTHLAKTTVRQSADLERERGERLRADEDLHFQQILLNRSLEEKIQLGRELHDGVIQSLYATGLTLEAAKNQLPSNPTEAARQLETGLKALNSTIRDVRGYISGLSPDKLREQSFAESVLSLTQTLGGGRTTTFDLRIDETAAGKLTDTQSTDLLQIIREAVSNSLRHGRASKITLRLHESDGQIGLSVEDNGQGFDPARLSVRGHGLDNIKARADRIHAGLRVTSALSEGTRIVLTLTAESSIAS